MPFFVLVFCLLVFQSKVLQKLYPAVPKLEKDLSPPSIVDALAKKTYVIRKARQEDTATGKIRISDTDGSPCPLLLFP